MIDWVVVGGIAALTFATFCLLLIHGLCRAAGRPMSEQKSIFKNGSANPKQGTLKMEDIAKGWSPNIDHCCLAASPGLSEAEEPKREFPESDRDSQVPIYKQEWILVPSTPRYEVTTLTTFRKRYNKRLRQQYIPRYINRNRCMSCHHEKDLFYA